MKEFIESIEVIYIVHGILTCQCHLILIQLTELSSGRT